MDNKYASIIKTPIGEISVIADENAIVEITFSQRNLKNLIENNYSIEAAKQLAAYFEGSLKEFSIPFQQSGTDFQKEVWRNLLKIPYAETISYTKFAAHHPLAIRAIAAANGKNKIAIVIPCHRVIGKNGDLVGYAGELWRKKWLLQHEIDVAQKGQSVLKF